MRARPEQPRQSRRGFLESIGMATAALAAWRSTVAAQGRALGAAVSGYGNRSRFERASRLFPVTAAPEATASFTPLRDSFGIITPSSLHFERHHGGVPDLDPVSHSLTIHGLVEKPLVFSMRDLKRMPSASRVLFIECSGNSSSEWRGAGAPTVQRTHGLTSCSEWTGVLLSTLLRECGVRPSASWILAEGADAVRMARSIPLDTAVDEVLVAFAQNGEALRPEQGYPLRLVAPGWEGNVSVKWLHRLEALDGPAMTRWETARYTDLLPDGRARQFTFVMDAKSVITSPSGGDMLSDPGVYEVSGLAWSGRGAVRRVDVTADGGQTWSPAELQPPVLPRAHTRFRWTWRWSGADALLASRCEDDTGYVQPALSALVKERGPNYGYHQNSIQLWRVASGGAVTNGNS
jgi:sulfane dehydrogenase subunit SoxC